MDISDLRWNTRLGRSKRPRPPPDVDPDEYAAAMSLVLLLKSGGTDYPTIPPPEKLQEVPSSAETVKKQKLECERVLERSQALEGHMAVILECPFDSGQALADRVTNHWAPDISSGGSTRDNGDSGGASSFTGAKLISDSNMKPIVSITMFHPC